MHAATIAFAAPSERSPAAIGRNGLLTRSISTSVIWLTPTIAMLTVRPATSVASRSGRPGAAPASAPAIEGYDRAYYPAGIARHFAAILGSGSLLRYDREISAPTVVIHGKADKLMRPFGGRAIARAIKGARLVLFDGMGHELPEPLWDDIVGELKTNFAEAA